MKRALLSLLILGFWIGAAQAAPLPAESLANKIFLAANKNFRIPPDSGLNGFINLLKKSKPQGEVLQTVPGLYADSLYKSIRLLLALQHSHEHSEIRLSEEDSTALNDCVIAFSAANLALTAYTDDRIAREEDPSKLTDEEYEALKPTLITPLETIAANIKTAQRKLSDILFRRTGFRDPLDLDPQPETPKK